MAESERNGDANPKGESEAQPNGNSAEGIVVGGNEPRWNRRGGLTPVKARTVPSRMVWVNGRGCQRAYSYRPCAADAEMPVAFRSRRPSRPPFFISVCFDQPNRRIRDPYVRCCGRGAQR